MIVGVIHPQGSFIDRTVALTSAGNLFWLSPGGIQISGAGGFQGVSQLNLSTATGLRVGGFVFDALSTTALQAAQLSGEPLAGRAGLVTDPATLAEMGLLSNGDLSISGGLLTVDQGLLLDAQGGNVLLQAAGLQVPGGSVELAGRNVALTDSTVDVSSTTGSGGSIAVSGETVNLTRSVLDASGGLGGGSISLDAVQEVSLQGSDLLARGGGGSAVELQDQVVVTTEDARTAASMEDSTATGTYEGDEVASPPVPPSSEEPTMEEPVAAPVPLPARNVSGSLAEGDPAQGGSIQIEAETVLITGGSINASGTDGSGQVTQTDGLSDSWTLGPAAGSVSLQGRGGSVAIEGTSVLQGGTINAAGSSGGSVSIMAGDLVSGAPIFTPGIAGQGGDIRLLAERSILQTTSSALDASGLDGGGLIHLQAGTDLLVSGMLRAVGEGATAEGGLLEVSSGGKVSLLAASLDAGGGGGGGTIHVGGGFQGAALEGGGTNASVALVNGYTSLKANARQSGNGGTIVVWSEQSTDFYGSAEAMGGSLLGDGGLIEVSGRESLVFGGVADASAPNGAPGSLLLDPKNIIIDASGVGGFSYSIENIILPDGDSRVSLIETFLADSRILVSDLSASFAGVSGAAYFFDGSTGALLGALYGVEEFGEGDTILGSGLASSKLFLFSPYADVAGVADAGALTWVDLSPVGSSTPSIRFVDGSSIAVIGSSISLVGGSTGDFSGYSLEGAYAGADSALNGSIYNYLVLTPGWDGAGIIDVGAVTWIEGASGQLSGGKNGALIGTGHSLVGSNTGDFASPYLRDLDQQADYNRLILTPLWDNALQVDAGALTWINSNNGLLADGATGGEITASRSLLNTGSAIYNLNSVDEDGTIFVDNTYQFYTVRDDFFEGGGSVLVYSGGWDAGSEVDAGAITWMDGRSGGLVDGNSGGLISSLNSLVGSSTGDLSIYEGSADQGSYYFYYYAYIDRRDGTLPGDGAPLPVSTVLLGLPSWDGATASDAGAALWLNLDASTGVARLADGSPAAGVIGTGNSLVGSSSNDQIGQSGTQLSLYSQDFANGRLLLLNPNWDNATLADTNSGVIAVDAGAVTWLNPFTGALADGSSAFGAISSANSLVGTSTNDRIGSSVEEVYPQENFNFSPYVLLTASGWDNGAVAPDAGALLWIRGSDGSLAQDATSTVAPPPAVGNVSPSTALVGSSAGDGVGAGLNFLYGPYDSELLAYPTPNLLLATPSWDNGSIVDAGAVTWISLDTGRLSNGAPALGFLGSANSLVGSSAGDQIGSRVEASYAYQDDAPQNPLIVAPGWDGPSAVDAGAVTWISRDTGKLATGAGSFGSISSLNSLVGSSTGDQVGQKSVTLTNFFTGRGGPVTVALLTPDWDAGSTAPDAGAVTWLDLRNGIFASGSAAVGAVSASNSLVGRSAGDAIGASYSLQFNIDSGASLALLSGGWDNPETSAADAGAFTWMNGVTGNLADGSTPAIGAISNLNSLVGTSMGDRVADANLTDQSSNGMLLRMPSWDLTGPILSLSIVFESSGVGVGGTTFFADGEYILLSDVSIISLNGDGGLDPTFRLIGPGGAIDPSVINFDNVGPNEPFNASFFNVPQGTYSVEVTMPAAAGAASSSSGFFVTLSAPAQESVGLIAADAGAVAWVNLSNGSLGDGSLAIGDLSSANAFVGTSSGDQVGLAYDSDLIGSPFWDDPNGNIADVGALTWLNLATGQRSDAGVLIGALSSSNSLVGGSSGDRVGAFSSTQSNVSGEVVESYLVQAPQNNGTRLLGSPDFDGSGIADSGAVTFLDVIQGRLVNDQLIEGILGPSNSLLGATVGERFGVLAISGPGEQSMVFDANEGVLLHSPGWDAGSVEDAGAFAWMRTIDGQLSDGTFSGVIGSSNALLGSTAGDTADLGATNIFGNNLAFFPNWHDPTSGLSVGAMAWVSGSTGALANQASGGTIESVALRGAMAGDFDGYSTLSLGGNALVFTPGWDNGPIIDAGAMTWVNMSNGQLTSNLDASPVTFETLGASVSLVGSASGDFSGFTLENVGGGSAVLLTPMWDQGILEDAGAATWLQGATGQLAGTQGPILGTIGPERSIVGSASGDFASASLLTVGSNRLIFTPFWDDGVRQDVGALTWIDSAMGLLSDASSAGNIGTGISLVGTSTGDLFDIGLRSLSAGPVLISTPRWSDGVQTDAGALTWMNTSNGLLADGSSGGAIGISNSLLGTGYRPGDSTDLFYAINEFSFVAEDGSSGQSLLIYSQYLNPDYSSAVAIDSGRGALTWMDAGTGRLVNGSSGGFIDSLNSLVGSAAGDFRPERDSYLPCTLCGFFTPSQIYAEFNLIRSGSQVLVRSPFLDLGTLSNVGAVTWIDMATGRLGDGITLASGVLGSANSLVGTGANEFYGSRFLGLQPQFYDTDDRQGWYFGSNPVPELDRIVVRSPDALINGNPGAGAVTWIDLAHGLLATGAPVVGVVGSTNSLVGTSSGDALGEEYTRLTGDSSSWNLSFETPNWDNGVATDAGAVTWIQGNTGQFALGLAGVGPISSANSLVGSSSNDEIGRNLRLLGQVRSDSFGSYGSSVAYISSGWDNGSATDAGAVIWMNGFNGQLANGASAFGVVSSANALVGSTSGDGIGSFTEDVGYSSSGSGVNLLLLSGEWDNGSLVDAGAVTWIKGSTGQLMNGEAAIGPVSATFSLVGSQTGDRLGGDYLTFGSIFNFGEGPSESSYGRNVLLISPDWDAGEVQDAGAVTWISGSTGLMVDDTGTGVVSFSNSLIGNSAGDRVGSSVVKISDDRLEPNAFLVNGPGATDPGTGNPTNTSMSIENRIVQDVTISSRPPLSILPDSGDSGVINSAFLVGTDPGINVTILPGAITSIVSTGTNVTLQAANDIFLRSNSPITASGGAAGALTLQAGRSITLNSSITTSNGDLILLANDPEINADPESLAFRDAGAGSILQLSGTSIDAGSGTVTMRVGSSVPGAEASTISLAQVTAGSIDLAGPTIGLSGAKLFTPVAGGVIKMDADSLTLSSSLLDASTLVGDGGLIQLDGGVTTIGGSVITASSTDPSGRGGVVEVGVNSAARVPQLTITSSDLLANGVLDGGSISLDGDQITISGGVINSSATGDDPAATGGRIRIGSFDDDVTVIGYLPNVVNLNNATLIADPPAVGGLLTVNGVTINVNQSLFNVTGSTGGTLQVGSPATSVLAFGSGSTQLLGGVDASYTLQGTTIFGFENVRGPSGASIKTIGQVVGPPAPTPIPSPIPTPTPIPAQPSLSSPAPTFGVISTNVVVPTEVPIGMTVPLFLASPQLAELVALVYSQEPLQLQQELLDYAAVFSQSLVFSQQVSFSELVALSLNTTDFFLGGDPLLGANGVYQFTAEDFAYADMLDTQSSFSVDSDLSLDDSLDFLLQLDDYPSPFADGSVLFPADPSETRLALKLVLDLGLEGFVANSLDFSSDIRVGFSTLFITPITLTGAEAAALFAESEQLAQDYTSEKLGLEKKNDGKAPTAIEVQSLLQKIQQFVRGRQSTGPAQGGGS
ncbi:MAG: beta strand repeat-containing protein [Synechococcus sp.]